ncbi:MAG: biopolymer transporter ExbD [Phycisphaerales bacterium]|nr:biopolymer transporter ExbD [Phycisphaerae bacterium]NNF43316.1 biopolymer transporter ExbD [Phycisphaerales bacterium]NNM25555.1 biopolymer transporter ExbD [Phycisphaerales bacterium]
MIKVHEAEGGAAIELTPIIDMVFLLLIFFLVATTFHQTEREMQVALPEAAHAGPITASLREIIINVDRNGQIIISGRTFAAPELRALLEEAVTNQPEQKVTVRGDRDAAYAHVVRVLDICKGSGIQEPFLDTVVGGPEG